MSRRHKPHDAYRRRVWKPGQAHTQLTFCENNAISLSKLFDLKRRGLGPREIELDGRILITPEAEADWRKEREAETAKRRAEAAKAAADAASKADAGATQPSASPRHRAEAEIDQMAAKVIAMAAKAAL
jgi:hypothetical protein